MARFYTKTFAAQMRIESKIDEWLESLGDCEIVGYCAIGGDNDGMIIITVKQKI